MSVAILEQPNEKTLFCGTISFGTDTAIQSAFEVYYQTSSTPSVSGVITGVVPFFYRQIDRSYVISVGGISVAGTGPGIITFSNPLPTNLFNTPLNFPIWIQDGGQYSIGNFQINAGGIMTISKAYNSNFTGTGTCGFPEFNVVFASFLTV
jgi:hypothetical protein